MAFPIKVQRPFLPNTSISPGVERITSLLADIPLPWRAIHVAGTNGKGSICHYISDMLDEYNESQYRLKMRQRKIRHGRFTSPHLIDRWDCITIENLPVGKSLFLELESRTRERSERAAINASPFEILTATAFTAFTESKLDVAVVEVGMGGREDATNILGQDVRSFPAAYTYRDGNSLQITSNAAFRPQPLVATISKIGQDHQDFLGPDLRSIATHKAGVIKPHSPYVYDDSNSPEVVDVITQQCSDIGPASWRRLFGVDSIDTSEQVDQSLRSQYASRPLHMRTNSLVAFRSAWTALARLDNRVPVHDEILMSHPAGPETSSTQQEDQSLSRPSVWNKDLDDLFNIMLEVPLRTQIPGRQQLLDLQAITQIACPILLDGAHNEQSIKALSEQIQGLRRTPRTITSHQRSSPTTRNQDTTSASSAQPELSFPSTTQTSHAAEDPGKITYILAFSASKAKAVDLMLEQLLRPGDDVHAVEFSTPVDGMPWVQSAAGAETIQKAEGLGSRESGELQDWKTDVAGALQHVAERWRDGVAGHVVVTGSLYLVSDVHRLIRDAKFSAGSTK